LVMMSLRFMVASPRNLVVWRVQGQHVAFGLRDAETSVEQGVSCLFKLQVRVLGSCSDSVSPRGQLGLGRCERPSGPHSVSPIDRGGSHAVSTAVEEAAC
jgi:hypothetical protein